MLKLDLTDEEQSAVASALRRLIDEERFPFAPRLKSLKSALAKMAPPKPKAAPPASIAGAFGGGGQEEEGEAIALRLYQLQPSVVAN
jgi:hypothetical protein